MNKTNYIVRKIEVNDYNKKYLTLINEFKECKIDFKIFKDYIINLPYNHHIIVLENTDNIIIGTITIIIEKKLIHNISNVCHIEDLIILNKYKNQKLGTELLNIAKEYALKFNCYKIILNCNEELKKYYEKKDFYYAGLQMRIDF